MNRSMLSAGLLAAACAMSGCQSVYYGAMEKLGYEKRDILVGDDLMLAMKRAESRMEPVLKVLRDQVLFLKHNLNAQAIASIKNEIVRVGADVSALVKEMEMAIAEADKFIAAMPQG